MAEISTVLPHSHAVVALSIFAHPTLRVLGRYLCNPRLLGASFGYCRIGVGGERLAALTARNAPAERTLRYGIDTARGENAKGKYSPRGLRKLHPALRPVSLVQTTELFRPFGDATRPNQNNSSFFSKKKGRVQMSNKSTPSQCRGLRPLTGGWLRS